jgi:hypothetical protein
VHFAPTFSSWLNQVEIWFNIITQKAIRRGTFGGVKELVAKSNPSSIATMRRLDPSPGRLRPIQSWKKSSGYVNVFPGHSTSPSLDKFWGAIQSLATKPWVLLSRSR